MVESNSDKILADAEVVDVAFLVVGDPFGWVSPYLLITPSCDRVHHYPRGNSLTFVGQQLIRTWSSGLVKKEYK